KVDNAWKVEVSKSCKREIESVLKGLKEVSAKLNDLPPFLSPFIPSSQSKSDIKQLNEKWSLAADLRKNLIKKGFINESRKDNPYSFNILTYTFSDKEKNDPLFYYKFYAQALNVLQQMQEEFKKVEATYNEWKKAKEEV